MAEFITTAQWVYFKKTYPSLVSQLACVTVPVRENQLKLYWKAKKKASNKITQKLQDCSDPVGTLINWCKETLTENFYVEKANKEGVYVDEIIFYFFSEEDAVLFKLTWWGSSV